MTLTTEAPARDDSHPRDVPYTTVLCGSFHRAPSDLRAVHDALCRHYSVLSPVDIQWVDPTAPFVRGGAETEQSAAEIEGRHLACIRAADFVWLFCPDGYVGTSAAMEVGYAHAVGVPVLTDHIPDDATVASMVDLVDGGPAMALDRIAPTPGRPLSALQQYYARIADRRGWSNESPRDTLLLLTEELGELARAVRKDLGLSRDGAYLEGGVGEELADVQLYIIHLANALGVDLATAVTQKEQVNAARHASRGRAA